MDNNKMEKPTAKVQTGSVWNGTQGDANRPYAHSPNGPTIQFRSQDIGTKTAVRTNPFVQVERKKGLAGLIDRLRHSRTQKTQGANATQKDTTKSIPQPPASGLHRGAQSTSRPGSASRPTTQVGSARPTISTGRPASPTTSRPANSSATGRRPASASPSVASQSAAPNTNPTDVESATKPRFKLSSICHFLFDGWHKFLSIPIILVIVVETVLLILFVVGVFRTGSTAAETETIVSTTMDEATDIYDDITNDASQQNTLDYWNSQFAKYEARGSYHEAYELRIRAAEFYINREDNATAFTVLRGTVMGYDIGLAERYKLYALVATLSANLGEFEISEAYQKAAANLSDASVFDGSADNTYNQLVEMIPRSSTEDTTDDTEDSNKEEVEVIYIEDSVDESEE